jgi:hypothetical protein
MGTAHSCQAFTRLHHLRLGGVGQHQLGHQVLPHGLDVSGAHHFLARKVNAVELFADEQARHKNDRREVQQIDEHELAPHAQAAQPDRKP